MVKKRHNLWKRLKIPVYLTILLFCDFSCSFPANSFKFSKYDFEC